MNESISDSQIDNAWDKLLPELNQVLPEKKRKRFLLIPYLFTISLLVVSGLVWSNYAGDNTNLNENKIIANQTEKKANINLNSKNNEKITNEIPELLPLKDNLDLIKKPKRNSEKFVQNKKNLEVDLNQTLTKNEDVISNNIGSLIVQNQEHDNFLEKEKLKGLNIKFLEDNISLLSMPKIKIKKLNDRKLKNNLIFGFGILSATNSYTFNHQYKLKPINNLGFKAYFKYILNSKLSLNYSLNYLPLSVNYQFENHINSSLYFNKTSLYKFNTINHAIGINTLLNKNLYFNSGLYFATNMKKVNALEQVIYKVENSEKVMSENYKKLKNDFGVFKNDIGLTFGLEYHIKKFSISYNKNIGLVNVVKTNNYFVRNQNNVISLNFYIR